jgi:ribonuclease HI
MTFYVVWQGRAPGVYTTWEACESQVKGFSGARFRSYPDSNSAWQAFERGAPSPFKSESGPVSWAYAVDRIPADLLGVAGYRGIQVGTRDQIFKVAKTHINNDSVAHFLAICHCLAFCKKYDLFTPIYCSSIEAVTWVHQRRSDRSLSKLNLPEETTHLLDRANQWLRQNEWKNPILHWDIDNWGQIPEPILKKGDRRGN